MKIYRRVVVDIETGKTLEEDAYEYDGPVAEAKGGQNARNEAAYNLTTGNIGANQMFAGQMGQYMADRFGAQSDVFNTVMGSLGGVLGAGPYQYGTQPPGIQGGVGSGGGGAVGGGGGGSVGGGAGAGSGAGSEYPDWMNFQAQSGFSPGDYSIRFKATGFGQDWLRAQKERIAREISQERGQQIQSLQEMAARQGIEGSGVNLALRQQAEIASDEQKAAVLGGMRIQNAEQVQAQRLAALQANTALKSNMWQGRLGNAEMMNKYGMQNVQMRAQWEMQQRQLAAARQAAAQQAGAQRYAAQQMSAAQQNELNYRYAVLGSENFFRAGGMALGVADRMNPLGYGQLAGGAYGTGVQGSLGLYQNTPRSPGFWSTLGSAALGGILSGPAMGSGGVITNLFK